MAIALSLDMSLDELQTVLKKYGYYLSESVVADMVVKWFFTYRNNEGKKILHMVNEVFEEMELPLLMTRTK